jgi:hypothetical protein
MIDIVTVVFAAEIPVLRLQAQSIDLYCRRIGVRNIYVVVNDHESVAQQIDPAWWGAFAPQVLIVPRTVFSTEFSNNGWLGQQALKILTASISHNVWSMILDAKTVFVRDLDPAELVDSQGRMRVGHMPVYPVFEPARQIVNEFYEINLDCQLGPGGVPFFFHNDTVRLMIAETAFRARQSFPNWFQAQGRLTEFVLYSGFVKHRFGSFDAFYSPDNAVFPCNMCHSEVSRFNDKLAEMSLPKTNTVSIHRNAWAQLAPEQQQQYRDLLTQRGISQASTL